MNQTTFRDSKISMPGFARQLAFDNSLTANLIFNAGTGKVIIANKAACALLGYSKKEILTRQKKNLFNSKDEGFLKIQRQMATAGKSNAVVKVLKKGNTTLYCGVTSVVFSGIDRQKMEVMTLADMTKMIINQEKIDRENQKVVTRNIGLALLKQKDLDIKNNKIVEVNIDAAVSRQQGIDKKNKKTVTDNINNAILKQQGIDILNYKTVADNILLARIKSDARLARNNAEHIKKFNLATKLSYDGIWEWNLVTNDFVLGEGFEEMFGYTRSENAANLTNWTGYLHPGDRKAVEKGLRDAIGSQAVTWQQGFRFLRADQKVVNVFGRASIARDNTGKAYRMIGVIHDLSCQKNLEEKLEKQIALNVKQSIDHIENYKLVFNSSSDVLFDFDLRTNLVSVSDAFEKEFGYPTSGLMSPSDLWATHIHPDDIESLTRDYTRMIASADTEWKYKCRFLKADNTIASVLGSSIVLRNSSGTAYRLIGSMQDVSKQTVLEEKLRSEIRLKEKQISDAAEDARDTERSDIGKELHDNINQLLGASRLYVEMAIKGGPDTAKYLRRSSDYTLKAIGDIRVLSKTLTTDVINDLGLCEAIGNVSRDTMETSPVRIYCSTKRFPENSAGNKFKLNMYRIVQEQ
ncbi:MAG: PAS domain-containing protein, partial [Bacteroidota bacterium]